MGETFRRLTLLGLQDLDLTRVSNPQLARVLNRTKRDSDRFVFWWGKGKHTDTRSHSNCGHWDGNYNEHDNSNSGNHNDHNDHSDYRSDRHSDDGGSSDYKEFAGHTDSESRSSPHSDYTESCHTDESKYD